LWLCEHFFDGLRDMSFDEGSEFVQALLDSSQKISQILEKR
jgi:hypothetical protein